MSYSSKRIVTRMSFCLLFLVMGLALFTRAIPFLILWFVLFAITVLLMISLGASSGPRDWRQHTIKALPAATSPALMTRDGFALLDERFQAVVQVRARHFQTGRITLPEWEGRYQALLRARQELETSTFREALLRLDEHRTAVASRRLQLRYGRKLQALCDETMEAILQRADALMAPKQIAD